MAIFQILMLQNPALAWLLIAGALMSVQAASGLSILIPAIGASASMSLLTACGFVPGALAQGVSFIVLGAAFTLTGVLIPRRRAPQSGRLRGRRRREFIPRVNEADPRGEEGLLFAASALGRRSEPMDLPAPPPRGQTPPQPLDLSPPPADLLPAGGLQAPGLPDPSPVLSTLSGSAPPHRALAHATRIEPWPDLSGVAREPPDAGPPDFGAPDFGAPAPDSGASNSGLPHSGLPDPVVPNTGLPDPGGSDSSAPSFQDAAVTHRDPVTAPDRRSRLDRRAAAALDPEAGSAAEREALASAPPPLTPARSLHATTAEAPRRDGARSTHSALDAGSDVRMIGRIARAKGAFSEGSGVVVIDGAERGAQIEAGQASPAPDAPVRVLGTGPDGVLRVRSLRS